MTTIDDKVVAMSFESSKFENGVNKTILALKKLKDSLTFPEAGKDLQKFNDVAKQTDLSHISRSVDDIRSRLSALRIAAIAVFVDIARRAVATGARFVKAFTIDPLKAGFQEYTTNLNAVQTILANTQASGAGLKEVNAALKQLNDYSDKTIYNFSQMARNIGTFTAAGVDLDTATASIKGIANLAALSGSNAEQAANAMYQLSQAISAGRISLMDWNSVVNAGMGGTVFQRALAQTAEAMGTLEKGAVKLTGPMKNVSISGESFRQSLAAGPGKESWLTSDVLTRTLEQFTGDLDEAELKAQGFNEAQIKAIQRTAQTALKAATEVKTLSGVLDTARETAGSGWAQTWQIIFGDFGEAKQLFTGVSNAINGFIKSSADARNKVLGDWKKLGGRTLLIKSIKTAFQALGDALKPIKEAFREFFPATTGKDLFELTKRFSDFTKKLKPSEETINNLRRTFRGLFALLDIGKTIIVAVFDVFSKLIGATGAGEGGFLSFTASIGDVLVRFHDFLIEGDKLYNVIQKIGEILAAPVKMLVKLKDALFGVFEGASGGGFSDHVDRMTVSLTPFQRILEAVSNTFEGFLGLFDNVDFGENFSQFIEAFGKSLAGIGTAIGEALSSMNFEAILSIIRTGLFAALVVMFKRFLGKGSFADQLGGGILKNIGESFNALTGSMKAMQRNIQAKTLKEIAIAIALLTLSVVALSFVKPEKLKAALTAMAFAFAELLAAMAIMDKIGKSGGFLKMPFIAASMILLAGAIDVLTIAVVALSLLSWEDLLKGLGGVAALLASLSAAAIPLSANSAGLIRAGVGITAIAVALNILALAVRQFASMNLTELGKGIASVAAGLGIMVAAMRKMPVGGMVAAGVALVAVATAMKILASAMADFAQLKWESIGKGLASIAGSLLIIAVAMKRMPKNMVAIGAGLVLVGLSLKLIAEALAKMGQMSVEQIARSLVALGGALLILSKGLQGMTKSFRGAAALAIASAGLALLVPVLIALGKQKWENIIKSLVALGGAITVLGVAGAVIGSVVPALIGLGTALLLIGGSFALVGAGIFLISAGLSALAVSGPAGVGILIAAINELLEAIPEMAKNFALGLLEVVRAFAATAPKFVKALVKIVDSVLDVVIKSAPKLAEAFTALLLAALQVFYDNKDKLIKAGFDLIISLLIGLRDNIGKIVEVALEVIENFLVAIAKNIGKVISAGTSILIALLDGIASAIADVSAAAIGIVTKFIGTIGDNIWKVLKAGADLIIKLVDGVSTNLWRVVDAGKEAIIRFIEGVGKTGKDIIDAAVKAIAKFIKAISEAALELADEGAQAIINFLNGVADVIEQREPEMIEAGVRIGKAIVKGFIKGLWDSRPGFIKSIEGIAGDGIDAVKKKFGSRSPSVEFMKIGQSVIDGLVLGISDHQAVIDGAIAMSQGVISAVKNMFKITSPSKVMYDIGLLVQKGFAEGLLGGAQTVESALVSSVKNAFDTLNQALLTEIADARSTIADETAKIRDLRAGRKDSSEAISDERERLEELTEARTNDNKAIEKQRDTLETLRRKNRENTEEIAEEEKALKNLIAARAKSTEAAKDTTAIEAQQEKIAQLKAARKENNAAIAEEEAKLESLMETKEQDIEAINDTKERLQELREGRINSNKAIADSQKIIEQNQAVLAKLTATRRILTQDLQDEKKELIGLASEYDKISTKLEDANEALAEAKRTRDEAIKSFTDQYSTLPEIVKEDAEGNAIDQLAAYMQALKFQADAVAAYQTTLDQLRKLGLDDATYQKLLREGTANQQFADALLAGGKTAVDSLNALDVELLANAQRLATSAGNGLYQAGVDAAQGLVDGLMSKKSELRKAMEDLADEIVRALKRKLKIKSPSEIFAEIGRFAMEGMAKGFTDSTSLVKDAVDVATKEALSAMEQSMRDISNIAMGEIDTTPVITPILDLSKIRSQAGELDGLTTVAPISVTASLGQATVISSEQVAAQMDQGMTPQDGATIKFEQNNYSPKSLSEIDIYRQTQNQLSQFKSVLGI